MGKRKKDETPQRSEHLQKLFDLSDEELASALLLALQKMSDGEASADRMAEILATLFTMREPASWEHLVRAVLAAPQDSRDWSFQWFGMVKLAVGDVLAGLDPAEFPADALGFAVALWREVAPADRRSDDLLATVVARDPIAAAPYVSEADEALFPALIAAVDAAVLRADGKGAFDVAEAIAALGFLGVELTEAQKRKAITAGALAQRAMDAEGA
jgi:hypothetical protein